MQTVVSALLFRVRAVEVKHPARPVATGGTAGLPGKVTPVTWSVFLPACLGGSSRLAREGASDGQ
jgi:hypothetical protein